VKLPRFTRSRWLVFTFLACFMALLWLTASAVSWKASGFTSLHLPTEHIGDLATVLFSGAALALFVLSIFIAFLAVFGWSSIEDTIRTEVKAKTDERLAAVEKELRGRAFALGGFIIGESISGDAAASPNEDLLLEAIRHSRTGYDLLKEVPGPGQYMALNNLLSYSCTLGDKARANRGYLLEGARKLRQAGEEHDVPNLLLTYCRSILIFSLEPREVDEACAIVADLNASQRRLTPKERREADALASLCLQRANLRPRDS
jgi:hypothetical protein